MGTTGGSETVRLAAVPIPVALVDPSGVVEWANEPLLDLLGADPTGSPFLDLVAERTVDDAHRVLDDGVLQTVVLTTTAGECAVELFSAPASDGTSAVVFAQKSRVELEILDDLARKANDLLGQGVIIGDATRCLHVSPAAAKIFGRSVEELLGLDSVFGLFEENERRRITALVTACAEAGRPMPEHYETVIVRPDGTHLPVDVSIKAAVRGTTTRTFTIITDASERRAKQRELAHRALHDELTDLPNRSLLLERLERTLARMAREPAEGTLLFIDLDRFKEVNDRFGHAAGDMVLRTVAGRLQDSIRTSDTAARIGGDEFVVLVGHPTSTESGAGLAERLRTRIAEPIDGDGWSAEVGASIGILSFDDAVRSADELLDRADQAMYAEKTGGLSST